jgi:ankyrin repeat protein
MQPVDGKGRFVESLEELRQLRDAIDRNDFTGVQNLMTRNPGLHKARLGYGKDGPLTLAAECGTMTESRLSIVRWMIENGSDVHQGGDGPLMRAALSSNRIPMMELLVSHGANVNAEWHNGYPIIFAACETVDPASLKWLLDHGANPNCDRAGREHRGTALEYVIASYVRSPELGVCIDLLVEAGGVSKYDAVVLDALRGNLDRVAAHLDADPALIHRRFPQLDFGTTGGRMLTLGGATLLHVAAEYVNGPLATLLLDRGADINAPALVDEVGVGGQTPIFHAVTQFNDAGVPMVRLLLDRGADVSIRAKVPGHYERPGEILECTPLGYATHFRDETSAGDKANTIALLKQRGAPE